MDSEREFRMRKGIWCAIFALAMGFGAASLPERAHGQATSEREKDHPAKSAVATGPLKISYEGKTAEWTVASLASLPHMTIKVYNEHAKAEQTYTGVPMTTLLTQLGVPDKPHGKEFRLYLVAEGADGYQVVYSVGEVTPDVHDGTTLVADALDGKPLTESGPVQLVTTGEKRPARWVRNLVAIRVLTAQ